MIVNLFSGPVCMRWFVIERFEIDCSSNRRLWLRSACAYHSGWHGSMCLKVCLSPNRKHLVIYHHVIGGMRMCLSKSVCFLQSCASYRGALLSTSESTVLL